MRDKVEKRIVKLKLAGHPNRVVCDRTGWSMSRISRFVQRAREAGLIPPRGVQTRSVQITTALAQLGCRRGSIQQTLDTLPKDVRWWVIQSLPEGSSVAEFIAAVLVDTYYDEQATKKSHK